MADTPESRALKLASDHYAYVNKQSSDKAEIAKAAQAMKDAARANDAALAAARKNSGPSAMTATVANGVPTTRMQRRYSDTTPMGGSQ